jgi:hypothetical protein
MSPDRSPCPELLQFLKAYDPAVGELALAVRRLVLEEAPAASEIVYDAYNAVALGFTLTGRFREAFCHVAVYTAHVNLGFNHGAYLPDPDGLLEGTGKHIRHLRLTRLEDLRRPHLRRFLRAALAHMRGRGGSARELEEPITVIKTTARKRRPSPRG